DDDRLELLDALAHVTGPTLPAAQATPASVATGGRRKSRKAVQAEVDEGEEGRHGEHEAQHESVAGRILEPGMEERREETRPLEETPAVQTLHPAEVHAESGEEERGERHHPAERGARGAGDDKLHEQE